MNVIWMFQQIIFNWFGVVSSITHKIMLHDFRYYNQTNYESRVTG